MSEDPRIDSQSRVTFQTNTLSIFFRHLLQMIVIVHSLCSCLLRLRVAVVWLCGGFSVDLGLITFDSAVVPLVQSVVAEAK